MNPITVPISALLAMLPPPVRPWVEFAISIICLASLIVGATNKRDAAWAKVLRFISAAVHRDEPGTLKIPATNLVLGVSVSKPSTPGFSRFPLLVVIAFAAIAGLSLHACAGSTTNIGATSTVATSPGGDVSWTAGVNVTIAIAQAAIPAAKGAFDASPSVHPDARQTGDRVFQTAMDSLPLMQTALNTFTHAPSPQSKCQVHFYAEQILTAALQGTTIAKDAGAPLPPELSMALGGLAAIDDALFPGCGTSAPPMARRMPAQERVRAVFGAHQ